MLVAQVPPKPRKPVRKVRTEHGTRVARAIVCASCGARDTIHFAPKDPAKVLCRRCAADLLGVDDPDTEVGSLHPFTCASCGREGMTRVRMEAGGRDFLCKDCLLGIESKQKTRATRATRLSNRVLRVRKSPPKD
jgi:hypothetical protein